MALDWNKFIDDDGQEWTGEEARDIKEVSDSEKQVEMEIRAEQRVKTKEIWDLKKSGLLTREKLAEFHAEWRQLEMLRMSVGSTLDRKNLFEKKTADAVNSMIEEEEPESESDLVAEAKQLSALLSDRVKGAQADIRRKKRQAAYDEETEGEDQKKETAVAAGEKEGQGDQNQQGQGALQALDHDGTPPYRRCRRAYSAMAAANSSSPKSGQKAVVK